MSIKYDYSFGIVPLKKRGEVWYVLLVQLHAGHWGFPKGHADPQESNLETAERELLEETGLTVSQLLTDQTFEEAYSFKARGDLIHKKVIYYLAQVQGEDKMLEEEIRALLWIPLLEAQNYLTFDQGKNICRQVVQIVKDI